MIFFATLSVLWVRQLPFAAGGALQGLPLKRFDVFEPVANVAPELEKGWAHALGSPSGDGRQTDRPALGKNFGREDGVFHGASRLRLRHAYERAVLNGSQVECAEPDVRLGTRVQW